MHRIAIMGKAIDVHDNGHSCIFYWVFAGKIHLPYDTKLMLRFDNWIITQSRR